MRNLPLSMMSFLLALMLAAPTAVAADEHGEELKLSPELRSLLQAEMRELLAGSQAIAAALPTGDWAGLGEAARKMQGSYVMAQKLTDEQKAELGNLPEHFRHVDASFHGRAGKLAEAAMHKDVEAAAFHYSRMLEACAACHSAYAAERFPGLRPAAQEHGGGHHH